MSTEQTSVPKSTSVLRENLRARLVLEHGVDGARERLATAAAALRRDPAARSGRLEIVGEIMKTLSLVALLTLPSLARAADDAPVEVVLVPGFTCVPDAQRINEGKATASCLATNESLKKGNVIMSVPAFIATTAGLVVLAIGAGVAIGVAASEKP